MKCDKCGVEFSDTVLPLHLKICKADVVKENKPETDKPTKGKAK